ncbi:succinate-semialdehyde dehydrogenase/glutarate-semialdehyde dehydrogenase [Desmospora profundinema]|uniref:Succinate-semialdehyde dehydrogenase/glutarate-semialdehyde dehydrogenase n=2 Tax=Desmospora profundinema TaxID=1571184 RepID=A0ABU1INT3_9BACL|nr:succinate-semialdehyde dehydrogenase/glutarate-semialdehyde dehydrogenase [Desmospora profundinema]
MNGNTWMDEALCWINGERRTLFESMEVIDPSNGERIGNVPLGGAELAEEAVTAAWEAFPAWSSLLPRERACYLTRWAEKILQHKEELAPLLTREQGKPLAESTGELEVAASFVQWYAEEAKRVSGEVLPPYKPNQRITVIRQPVGVAALITPWNYPAAMVTRKAAPALAAGCTVVLKPAKQTPLIAIALFRLLMETGLPAGAANLVTGAASAIGEAWLGDPRVRKVSFTGSTEVGKKLMRQAADQVKRVSLELGGNAPAIVFGDADLERAAAAIADNKFENCGQMCNGINRIYAEETVAEELAERMVAKVKQMRVGPGIRPGIHIGPLIHDSARRNVHRLVSDAVEKGARLRTGGHPLTEGEWAGGSYYAPTVLTGVDESMDLTREEVFGPVAPILSFRTEEEVVDQANQTPYGLAAYLFTRDVARTHRVSEKLEFGMVGVNGTSLSVPQAPFGGIKESGVGREGGRYGLEEFLELKTITAMVD